MMRVRPPARTANPVPALETEQKSNELSARARTEPPRRRSRRPLGGADPGRTVEVSYATPGAGPETAALTEGKEYVLLLDAQDDGRFTLVNTTQGVYEVNGGRAVAGPDNEVALSAGALKALRLASSTVDASLHAGRAAGWS